MLGEEIYKQVSHPHLLHFHAMNGVMEKNKDLRDLDKKKLWLKDEFKDFQNCKFCMMLTFNWSKEKANANCWKPNMKWMETFPTKMIIVTIADTFNQEEMHRFLFYMGLHRCRSIIVAMLTNVQCSWASKLDIIPKKYRNNLMLCDNDLSRRDITFLNTIRNLFKSNLDHNLVSEYNICRQAAYEEFYQSSTLPTPRYTNTPCY